MFEELDAKTFEERIGKVDFPKFYKLHQVFPDDALKSPYDAVLESCRERGVLDAIKPGMSVAIACGSRELAGMVDIVRATVDAVRFCGANPFIIPAMGSHGNMMSEGQQAILEHYGITEETVGAPIRSQMTTVCVGYTEKGVEVHMDKLAYEADFVIPINRIKAHTDFRGEYESGMIKMLAIGVGKQHGVEMCHRQGFWKMAENIVQFGSVILRTGKVPFGIASIENERHQCCKIIAIPEDKFLEEEPPLLAYAKSRMPRLPFEQADLLLVDQIGKDFGGTGMDPNVFGRSPFLGISKPWFERIVIFDLTEKSFGNSNGMGNK